MDVIAHGRWAPADVRVRWRRDAFVPEPRLAAAADAALAALAARGSPSHDSQAARVAGLHAGDGTLALELQPVRWSLRLVPGGASQSLYVHCLVRDGAGRWLAGRRSAWLAILPGEWHLGAAGSVGVDEDPVDTLRRELAEEWSFAAAALDVVAIVGEPSGQTALIGLARVPDGAQPRLNDEHDDWAWWPADPADWPAVASAGLRELATLVA